MKTTLVGCILCLLTIFSAKYKEIKKAGICKSHQGATFLALLNPKFPLKEGASLLNQSPCPSVGVLYRTFGLKLSRIVAFKKLIKKKLKVLVYADCGPCRWPRRPKGYADHFRTDLSIDEFNDLFPESQKLRSEYKRKALLPIIRFIPKHKNIIWEISPALEDDYNSDSWPSMLRLIRDQKRRSKVSFGIRRNPLIYTREVGYKQEAHTCRPSMVEAMKPKDSLSFDGVHIAFPGEHGECRSDQAKKVMAKARAKRIDTYLWRAPWQGLPIREGTLGAPIPERTYKVDKITESGGLLRAR